MVFESGTGLVSTEVAVGQLMCRCITQKNGSDDQELFENISKVHKKKQTICLCKYSGTQFESRLRNFAFHVLHERTLLRKTSE